MKVQTCIAFLLACVLLFSPGCGTSQVVANLQLAVDALEIAVPLIGPAAGLPPALLTQIEAYLSATSVAIGKASDILSGPGTDAEKSALIVAAFAQIAVPQIPAQFQGIATAIQKVAQMVANFLAGLPASHPAVSASPGRTTALSIADREKLAGIKMKMFAIRIGKQ